MRFPFLSTWETAWWNLFWPLFPSARTNSSASGSFARFPISERPPFRRWSNGPWPGVRREYVGALLAVLGRIGTENQVDFVVPYLSDKDPQTPQRSTERHLPNRRRPQGSIVAVGIGFGRRPLQDRPGGHAGGHPGKLGRARAFESSENQVLAFLEKQNRTGTKKSALPWEKSAPSKPFPNWSP